jgi:dTDP-glucose 4,6-dehydratase
MGKRVLVTGAGGFIGSHLVELLVREGHEVRAFLRYNGRDDRGQIDRLPDEVRRAVEVHRGDLKDPEAVRKAVEGRAWVFHLGALIAIPYSYQNPLDVVQTNVVGTAHVLDACRANPELERVVLTSTSEVYGTAQYVPIDEKHPLRGQSPYAATKIGADALGESYHRAFGLPVAILRPFNTFGPRQSARAIIPTIISQALARPVVRLGSLDPRRDLTYVKDTAAGFLAIAGSDAAIGRVVNIGRGDDLTIGELVERIGQRLGRPIRVETDASRVRPATSEVGRLLAGTALAQELFDWRPKYTLDQALDETIAWVRDNLGLFRVDQYTT